VKRFFAIFLVLISVCSAQKWQPKIPNLILDTLIVPLAADSLDISDFPEVLDTRKEGGNYLVTRQKLKIGKYIPVDERVVLTDSLSLVLGKSLAADSVRVEGRLVIDHLSLWYDSSIPRRDGWVLNGYTREETTGGETVRDWQWEVREEKEKSKKGKKQKGEAKEKKDGFKLFSKKEKPSDEEIHQEKFNKLISRWMTLQAQGLKEMSEDAITVSTHPYRRQFLIWADMIIYPDGFGVEARLSLDYPMDQYDNYERGIAAFYFRQGPFYQTVAIEKMTKLWYRRFNEKTLFRTTVTGRFGFNGYDQTQFEYLDVINIFNLGATVSPVLEYRPPYHKGFFFGAGFQAGINFIPALVSLNKPSSKLNRSGVPLDTFELGLILTVGYRRP